MNYPLNTKQHSHYLNVNYSWRSVVWGTGVFSNGCLHISAQHNICVPIGNLSAVSSTFVDEVSPSPVPNTPFE